MKLTSCLILAPPPCRRSGIEIHFKKAGRRDARAIRSIWSRYKLPSLSQSNDITHARARSGYVTRWPLSCRETPDAHINMEKKFDSPKVHVTRFPASARIGPLFFLLLVGTVWKIFEVCAQPTCHIFACHCYPSLSERHFPTFTLVMTQFQL